MPAFDDYCCAVCTEWMGIDAKRRSPVCSNECHLVYNGQVACESCGEIYPLGSDCSSCVPDLSAVIELRVPEKPCQQPES